MISELTSKMDILTNFGIQPTLLLAQIVNFAIILFLLKWFFYKPIIKILEERRAKIEESLRNADLIEEKLQKTEEQTTKALEEAASTAKSTMEDATKEAQRITDQAVVDSRKIQEEALEAAKAQVEMQKLEIKKQLEHETMTLVVEVVKKVLGRNLKQKEKQQLTSAAASEIVRRIH